MDRQKYLKYKKKYLQLKNDIDGGQHVKISFSSIECNENYENDMNNESYIKCSLKEPKIGTDVYKDINGSWYGDYSIFSEYSGNFLKDDEYILHVNNYGFWDGNDYYGITGDNGDVSQNVNLTYHEQTNQEYGDRFRWFDATSYIGYKFKNNEEAIKKIFNDEHNWEFSNGYGDGFCSLYAFFLLHNKISKDEIIFPIIEENEFNTKIKFNELKIKKTKIFADEYLIPLFNEIYNLNMEKNIELTTKNNKTYYLWSKNLQHSLDNFHNLNIQYISDDIFLYLSLIYNVNIIFIPFVKEEDKFNPPMLYSEGKLIMADGRMDTIRKILLKFNNYIILLYDNHYYPIDNQNDIIKYQTLLYLFSTIAL
jgi:hypothetical protein